jgi:sorbitol-specific phosphotransferase system component IIA
MRIRHSRKWLRAVLVVLAIVGLVVLGATGLAQAQQPTPATKPASPIGVDPLDATVSPPKLLSLAGGRRLMDEAAQAIARQDYKLAVSKLQDARQVFNQISTFHSQLVTSFTGIDNQVADSQRRKAGEAAELRDQATYRLALVHRAQQESDLAIPLLVQIIRSQQPTRELGQKAYQQLLEIGFVDVPFPRFGDTAPRTPGTPVAPTQPTAPTPR